MLHLVSGLYSEWTRKARFNVLVLGPAGCGKSSLVEALKTVHYGASSKQRGLTPDKVRPTVGQNVAQLPLRKRTLHLWDLGGSDDMQRLWPRYYAECDALLWVVDARWWDDVTVDEGAEGSDAAQAAAALREKASSAWDLLGPALQEQSMRGKPFLIVLNKTDGLVEAAEDHKAAQIAELEETARLWWGSRLASVLSGPFATQGEQAAADPAPATAQKEPAGPAEAPRPDPAVAPTSAGTPASDTIWDVVATSAVDLNGMRDTAHFLELLSEQRAT